MDIIMELKKLKINNASTFLCSKKNIHRMKTQILEIIFILSKEEYEQFVKFDLTTFTESEMNYICDSSNIDFIKFIFNNLSRYNLENKLACKLLKKLMVNKCVDIDVYQHILDKFLLNLRKTIDN